MIVALCGARGAGRKLVSARLLQRHGFSLLRFDAPIHAMLTAGLGLTERDMQGDAKLAPASAACGMTPLHLLQTLGFGWGRRQVHPDLWAARWEVLARAVDAEGRHVLADHTRFPNEAAAARRLGGEVWRVDRPGYPIEGATSADREQAQIEADRILVNATSISDLLRQVDNAVARYRET